MVTKIAGMLAREKIVRVTTLPSTDEATVKGGARKR
jgi:hypothetical protein